MTAPSLSVVITCHGEGRLVLDAIASAQEQVPAPFEVVVVNDASTDIETREACDEAERRGCRVLRRAVNAGPSAARNDGFALASGEVIVPLDADDLLPPGALGRIEAAFAREPAAGFVYGSYFREDSPGQRRLVLPPPPDLAQQLSAKHWGLGTRWTLLGTSPLRRALWEGAGRYDSSQFTRGLEDVDFWIRVISLSRAHARADGPLYIWRKHLGRTSRRVDPATWARLVTKHVDTYRSLGLGQRATELLLLDAKWRGDATSTSRYRAALWANLTSFGCRPSTLISLAIPGPLLRAVRRLSASP